MQPSTFLQRLQREIPIYVANCISSYCYLFCNINIALTIFMQFYIKLYNIYKIFFLIHFYKYRDLCSVQADPDITEFEKWFRSRKLSKLKLFLGGLYKILHHHIENHIRENSIKDVFYCTILLIT